MLTVEPLHRSAGTTKNHDDMIRTVCRECTAGCGLLAYVKDERIVDIQGDESHPINRGRLCAGGSAFARRLSGPDRITLTLARGRLDGPFEEMDNWEKGLDVLADRLRQVREQYGAESLVVNCNLEAGSDFALGALRFAKLWGTPHVYPRHNEANDQTSITAMPHGSASCLDWPGSGCLMLMETDLAGTHPVLFGWVLEAQRRGAKVCAVDTRFTATLAKADMTTVIRPANGNLVGFALMKVLLEEKRCSAESIRDRFIDSDSWQASFTNMSLEAILRSTGLSPELLRQMARFLADHGPVTVITGRDLSALPHSRIWRTLADAMGWADEPSGGWYPLASGLPFMDVTSDVPEPEKIEPDSSASKTNPSPPKNLQPATRNPQPATRAFDTASETVPHALIFSGNILNDHFFPFKTLVNEMDLAVYFGSWPNQAEKFAHMVFPAAAWPERDELCFSENRAIQWGRRIIGPGETIGSGLDFWTGLARRFGWEAYFPWKQENGLADHHSFYDWAMRRCPRMQGLNVDKLCDTPHLIFSPAQEQTPAKGQIAPMHAPNEVDDASLPDDADLFPLFYTAPIDSSDEDSHGKIPSMGQTISRDRVLIHPEIGQALGIQTGDTVIVKGIKESWKAKARLSRMVPRWMVRSVRSCPQSRVLIYKAGETPERSLDTLKAILP